MTRMQLARRNVRIARYAIGAVAAAAFAGLGVAAKAAHPGASGHHTSASTQTAADLQPPASFREAEQQSQQFFQDSSGGSSISPAQQGSASAVQSSGS